MEKQTMNRVEYLYIKTEKAMSLWNKCVTNPTTWNRDRFADAMWDIILILGAHGDQTGYSRAVLVGEQKAQYVMNNAMVSVKAFEDVATQDAFRALLGVVKHLRQS